MCFWEGCWENNGRNMNSTGLFAQGARLYTVQSTFTPQNDKSTTAWWMVNRVAKWGVHQLGKNVQECVADFTHNPIFSLHSSSWQNSRDVGLLISLSLSLSLSLSIPAAYSSTHGNSNLDNTSGLDRWGHLYSLIDLVMIYRCWGTDYEKLGGGTDSSDRWVLWLLWLVKLSLSCLSKNNRSSRDYIYRFTVGKHTHAVPELVNMSIQCFVGLWILNVATRRQPCFNYR